MNLPQHIVLIPDGNRRWAKKRGLPPFFGHRQGVKTTEKILKAVLDLKIPYLTFWGSSLDNIAKRPSQEVKFLFKIFEQHFKKLAKSKEVNQNKIKINILGRWRELFPESVKQAMEEVIKKTKDYKNYQLTFLMAYSGVDEMTSAIQGIAELRIKNAELRINEELIKNNLWTKDLPAVDLVIRTGGEPHWSAGMMMWDVANSQLYFTETLYPDFSVEEFKKAVNKYGQIERRMGK
ncbi:MAG: polyprenyl diphosphate synthase [bacterium]|nr:polyprenyl diphosphate synthase [bacterium]